MSNISDIIEDFIINTLGEAEQLDISRNELANYFNVAPSQINYVLSTRFNFERGFVIESKRGGGGHITIMRAEDSEYLTDILKRVQDDLDYRSACYILDELVQKECLSEVQAEILKTSISPNALNNPFKLENRLRAQILRRVLLKNIALKESE